MEHIEECGVHSGDASCVLPPYHLTQDQIERLTKISKELALALNVKGLMNVQLAIREDKIYLIEVNPRAARTVPFVSKATGLPLAKIAARVMTGKTLAEQGVTHEVIPPYYSVKEVVLPFAKFPGSDPLLGPEMRSTGETMGTATTFPEAYAKSQLAAKAPVQRSGTILLSIKKSDQDRLPALGKLLVAAGFKLEGTKGTCNVLKAAGLDCVLVNKVYEGRPNLLDFIKSGRYSWVINTTEGRQSVEDSRSLRRSCLRYGIYYTTTLNAAFACIEAVGADEYASVHSLQELHKLVDEKYSK